MYIHLGGVRSISPYIVIIVRLVIVVSICSGGLWTSYGLLVSDNTVILVNVIGAVLQSLYFVCYYKYSEDLVCIQVQAVNNVYTTPLRTTRTFIPINLSVIYSRMFL